MFTEFNLDVALIHYPVINRKNELIGSAVTNLDLHDIARASRTYGVGTYWVVTPDIQQQELAAQIVAHWTTGYGGTVNADRANALSLIRICSDFDEVVEASTQKNGERPLVVATSAGSHANSMTYGTLKKKMEQGVSVLVLFGTAWGLAPEIMEKVDCLLPSITGPGEYNHLAVRSAASIVLDRLLGDREKNAM